MGLPANAIKPIIGYTGDASCRTYTPADSHASTRGYRHGNSHVAANQYILGSPFIATGGTTYTIRVKLNAGVTAPACAGEADAFAVGVLGRNAKTCKQKCTLYGMPSFKAGDETVRAGDALCIECNFIPPSLFFAPFLSRPVASIASIGADSLCLQPRATFSCGANPISYYVGHILFFFPSV